MNEAHIISRKINRFKRLVRRIKQAPGDEAKAAREDRKTELAYELNKLGIKVA